MAGPSDTTQCHRPSGYKEVCMIDLFATDSIRGAPSSNEARRRQRISDRPAQQAPPDMM